VTGKESSNLFYFPKTELSYEPQNVAEPETDEFLSSLILMHRGDALSVVVDQEAPKVVSSPANGRLFTLSALPPFHRN
jgi:hypothetical protein